MSPQDPAQEDKCKFVTEAFKLTKVPHYLQVLDPKKASYGVENATAAVVQLAQTTMRSELGRITLDKTFEERTALNSSIVKSIQYAVVPYLFNLCSFSITFSSASIPATEVKRW